MKDYGLVKLFFEKLCSSHDFVKNYGFILTCFLKKRGQNIEKLVLFEERKNIYIFESGPQTPNFETKVILISFR